MPIAPNFRASVGGDDAVHVLPACVRGAGAAARAARLGHRGGGRARCAGSALPGRHPGLRPGAADLARLFALPAPRLLRWRHRYLLLARSAGLARASSGSRRAAPAGRHGLVRNPSQPASRAPSSCPPGRDRVRPRYRDMLGLRVVLQPPRGLPAVEPGQRQVHHDQVRQQRVRAFSSASVAVHGSATRSRRGRRYGAYISRLSSKSSTSRIRARLACGRLPHAGGGHLPRAASRVNVEPLPTWLSSPIRPPSMWARRRQMASPRPAPPYSPGGRVVGLLEVLEDVLVAGRDPDAGVLHGDADLIGRGS